MAHPRLRHARRGFTIVEILVVIAIIVTLIAILLPAVQRVREIANSSYCGWNLHQIGVGFQAYANDRNNAFPTGGGDPFVGSGPRPRTFTVSGVPAARENQNWGWAYQILPYIERDNTWSLPQAADFGNLVANVGVNAVASAKVNTFYCPSRRAPQNINNFEASGAAPSLPNFLTPGTTDYAGNAGAFKLFERDGTPTAILTAPYNPSAPPVRNGIFVKTMDLATNDPVLRTTDLRDGASTTILIGEKRLNRFAMRNGPLTAPQIGDQLGYCSGYYNDTLRSGWLLPAADYPRGSLAADPVTGDPGDIPPYTGPPVSPPGAPGFSTGNKANANIPGTFLTDGFGSAHPTGMNVLFCDNSVRRISYGLRATPMTVQGVGIGPPFGLAAPPNTINMHIMMRLCDRSDGTSINASDIE